MKKADIVILLSPSIVFVVIAIAAFWMAQDIKRWPFVKERDQQQRWETFLEQLDSGKAELKYDKATEDSMLEALRLSHRIMAIEHNVSEGMIEMHRDVLGLATLGVVFQVAAVLSVRRRLRKK